MSLLKAAEALNKFFNDSLDTNRTSLPIPYSTSWQINNVNEFVKNVPSNVSSEQKQLENEQITWKVME